MNYLVSFISTIVESIRMDRKWSQSNTRSFHPIGDESGSYHIEMVLFSLYRYTIIEKDIHLLYRHPISMYEYDRGGMIAMR